MMRKRRTYPPIYKAQVVLEVLNDNNTMIRVAEKNNISISQVSKWKKKFLENAELVFENHKKYNESIKTNYSYINDYQDIM